MRVLYCSYSAIPSNYANSIAVMQQCSALNKEVSLRVVLIRGDSCETSVFQQYSVSKFPLYRLPKWCLKYNEMGLKIAMLLHIFLWHPNLVYTRDILLNSCLCTFHVLNIYEIHQLDMEDAEFDVLFKHILSKIKKNKFLRSIVCISGSLKKECIQFGIPEEKISVLHNGVSLYSNREEMTNVTIPEFEKDRPLAIYVGSLQKGKGIEVIVKMAELSDRYNYLIIGGKKGTIRETENLKHISQVTNEVAREYMKKADFLLLPMVSQRYKFHSPLKLFEYLAAGKPIIASMNEDIAEILTDKENAMIAEENNPMDFIRCMDLLDRSDELKERIGRNSVKTATEFTWEKRAYAISELIERVIK